MTAIDWQAAIELLGGGTVVLGFAAWLIKSLITHGLTRDAEKFRITLKSDADAEMERLKNSLQIIATEHQVRFSKLHERRAEVIAELYDKVVHVFWIGRTFVYTGGRGSKEGEEYQKAEKQLFELTLYIDKHRIYLPEHICELIDQLVDDIRRMVIKVNVYGGVEYPTNERTLKEREEALMKAFDAFETKLPNARRALEAEFRSLLGEQGDRSASTDN